MNKIAFCNFAPEQNGPKYRIFIRNTLIYRTNDIHMADEMFGGLNKLLLFIGTLTRDSSWNKRENTSQLYVQKRRRDQGE